MRFSTDSLGLSGSVTTILRDLIHAKLGLMYDAAQFDQVADRLAPLIVDRGLGSFMEYYYLLKYSADAKEWSSVLDALAVQETYFWREIDQLRAVVTDVVPTLVEELNGEPLRIWSVPCATGEEPLTIAMLLSEAGWFSRAPIQVLASDGSPAAIERARAGRYTDRSFRNLPVTLREKYFIEHDGYRSPISPLRERVTYDVINLVDEEQAVRHAGAAIVFCRNLFIYFSDASIRRALGIFERLMPAPGYLCVGASESLLRRTAIFELQDIAGAFMYVKKATTQSSVRRPGIERAS